MATQFDSLTTDDAPAFVEREELERQQAHHTATTGNSESARRPCFNDALIGEFENHAERLRARARARRQAVQLKSIVLDREEREHTSAEDLLGRRQPQDEFQGDVNMRTLRELLKMIDDRGFERCAAFVQRLRRNSSQRNCSLLFVAVRCSLLLFVALRCRSPHQLKFHSAFERATARVIYRDDWGTSRPQIMRRNNWSTCPSEVLIRCAHTHTHTHVRAL